MDASESARLFHDLHRITETVAIEADDNKFVFCSEGDVGSSRTVLTANLTTKINVKNTLKQSYGMRYLNMFNKTATCSNEVKLKLAEGAPITLIYDLGTLGEVKYYLAPKKSDEAEVKVKDE